jgi:glucosyl-dolichyl phosphate glucuronosyltransferase
MIITAVVCTYNRCQSVAKTLDSLAASRLPETVDWEVLVVDNNSSDQTREVVEGFCSRYRNRFRYVFEPQPGKSYALNTGIREARGDVLAFLDDDVIVESTWLQNLTMPLGEWAGAGGRTLMAGTFSRPPWFFEQPPDDLRGVLAAVFDMGAVACDLDRAPYGANMAFRKDMFEKYGLFRTDLGPSPNREIPRPNEDTEFGRRLMAAGERLRYEPSAIAYHPVQEDRLQRSYFLKWYFDYGRAAVREWGRGPDIFGVPRRFFTFLKLMWTELPVAAMQWMVARNPPQRFLLKCRVWTTAGQIRESYRQWRSPERADMKFKTWMSAK